jgi:hypothetical protein
LRGCDRLIYHLMGLFISRSPPASRLRFVPANRTVRVAPGYWLRPRRTVSLGGVQVQGETEIVEGPREDHHQIFCFTSRAPLPPA